MSEVTLTEAERLALARIHSLGGYPRVFDKVVAAVERIIAARLAAADRDSVLRERIEVLADKWIAEDDTTQWGSHAKSACARALRAELAREGTDE